MLYYTQRQLRCKKYANNKTVDTSNKNSLPFSQIADPEGKGIIEWEGFAKIAHLSTLRGNPDEELLEAFRRFDKGHTGNPIAQQ